MVLAVFVAVISRTGWNPIGPMLDATDSFGSKIVEPDRSDTTESLNWLSLNIGLVLGIMGLPHVMLRFLTVRDAKAARNSAAVAISIFSVFFLMLPIFGYAALNEIGKKAIVAANPAGNSAGPMLAQEVGGDLLYALVAGVTIATILAVLAGLAIAVSGAVAHDLYTSVFKRGNVEERGQLIVGRVAGAGAAVDRDPDLVRGQGPQHRRTSPTSRSRSAASTTMPTLLLTIYWRGFNQVGAVSAMVGGLTVALVLVFLGPDVMGKDDAIWPLAIPALVSVPAGFLFAYVGTRLGRGRVGSTGMPYDEFEARAFPQPDSRKQPLHARGAGTGRSGMSARRGRARPRRRDALGVPRGRRRGPDGARERFLRAHADALHVELSDGRTRPLRLEQLLARAAERVPGLVPGAARRWRPSTSARWPTSRGSRSPRGCCLAHVLAAPAAGAHLVWSMLRPTADGARAPRRVPRHRRRRPRPGAPAPRGPSAACSSCATRATSTPRTTRRWPPPRSAVDLALLDPEIEVGVFRGGVVDHPRYAGRRIFGAGINLTHLYRGRISLPASTSSATSATSTSCFRGLSSAEHRPRRARADDGEAVDRRGRDLRDRRRLPAAARDRPRDRRARRAAVSCPRARRGSSPAPANLRLPRAVGDRLARQAILSGREFEAGHAGGRPAGATRPSSPARSTPRSRARRGADELRAGQRRRQPARPARRRRSRSTRSAPTWRPTAASRRVCHLSPALVAQPRAQLERQGAHAVSDADRARARASELRGAAARRLRETVERVLAAATPLRARLRDAGVDSAGADRRRSTTSRGSRSPTRPTCASTTRSGCWRSRASGSSASTRRAAPAASRPSSATRPATWTCGREVMARCMAMARRAPGDASSTTPTATGCSPAASASTRAPSASARRSCRSRSARPSAR